MNVGGVVAFVGIYGAALVAAVGTMFVLRLVKVI